MTTRSPSADDLLAAAHGLGDHPGRAARAAAPRPRRDRRGCGRRAAARRGWRGGLPAPNMARPAARSRPRSTRACRSGCPTGISRCWRRCSTSRREVERRLRRRARRRRAPSGALRKKSGECAILSTSSGMKFGIVRRQQPQGQDRLQRAADLERCLAALERTLHSGDCCHLTTLRSARRCGKAAAARFVGPRDDHNILWFGASRSRVCGSRRTTSNFRAQGKRRYRPCGDVIPRPLSACQRAAGHGRLALALGRALGRRREQAEIDVHRLEGLGRSHRR